MINGEIFLISSLLLQISERKVRPGVFASTSHREQTSIKKKRMGKLPPKNKQSTVTKSALLLFHNFLGWALVLGKDISLTSLGEYTLDT